jgi:hypothetical protein
VSYNAVFIALINDHHQSLWQKDKTGLNDGNAAALISLIQSWGWSLAVPIQHYGIHEGGWFSPTDCYSGVITKIGRAVINALAFGQQDEKSNFSSLIFFDW